MKVDIYNTDKKYKKLLNSQGYHIYCVRGNHEERPENIPGMILVEDINVDNITIEQINNSSKLKHI